MKLLRILVDKKGLTLIELLIVVAIITLLASVGAIMGLDAVTRKSLASERDTLVTLLTIARARSLANINQTPQGIHTETNNFVLFEGLAFNPSNPKNTEIKKTSSVSISGPEDVVFENLSAEMLVGAQTFILGNNSTSSSININIHGQINW